MLGLVGELLQAALTVGEEQRKREGDRCEPREHDVRPQVPHAEPAPLDDDEGARGDCHDEQVHRERADGRAAAEPVAEKVAALDDGDDVVGPGADEAGDGEDEEHDGAGVPVTGEAAAGHDAIVPPDPDLDALESRTAFREWSARSPGQRADPRRFGMLAAALGVDLEHPAPALGVVGSKGKGTTVAYASALLAETGLRVGTVFSPGLVSNRDRLRVDGAVLPLDRYAALLERVDAALRTLPDSVEGYIGPSGFFLAAGLAHFADTGGEALVLEAGIGGRRDDLGRVTLTGLAMAEIFLEHTDLLGDTIAAIADDKVGAARPGTRFVSHLAQSEEAETVIRRHTDAIGAERMRVDDEARAPYAAVVADGLGGRNAAHGMIAARRLLAELGRPDATAQQVRAAAEKVHYPGRLSRHELAGGAEGGAVVFVDSAVSRDGFENALAHVERVTGSPPALTLVSVPREKDLAGFRAVAAGLEGRVVFVALERVHLHYPERAEWPGEWATAAELPALLRAAPVVLAIGTASFSAEVLRHCGVNTDRVF